jgi:hypothetical protein
MYKIFRRVLLELAALNTRANLIVMRLEELASMSALKIPGLVCVQVRSMKGSKMRVVLLLPPPSAKDVAIKEVHIQVNSGSIDRLSLDVSATETPAIHCELGDVLQGSLYMIDRSGNRSEPRTYRFTIEDTDAPPMPGEIGVRLTEESEPEPDFETETVDLQTTIAPTVADAVADTVDVLLSSTTTSEPVPFGVGIELPVEPTTTVTQEPEASVESTIAPPETVTEAPSEPEVVAEPEAPSEPEVVAEPEAPPTE